MKTVKMRVRIYEITESQLTESGKGAKCSEAGDRFTYARLNRGILRIAAGGCGRFHLAKKGMEVSKLS